VKSVIHFVVSIRQVHKCRLLHLSKSNCIKLQNCTKSSNHLRCVLAVVWMCAENCEDVPLGMITLLCWFCSVQTILVDVILLLHWVSSTPHSANRKKEVKVQRGDRDNSRVHVYSRTWWIYFILYVKNIYLIVAFIVE